MAFDGITLRKIVTELQILEGGKVNQIHVPTNNNIIIGIYNGSNYALNIDTSASNYRIHLTTNSKPNPLVAPNFCMILRKYLVNSRISKIYMNGLERICYIDFECFNEMNDKVTRTLVIELMGKYSNVTLLNDKNKIIDALKKFDGEGISRSIMPTREYLTPKSDKVEFLDLSQKEFINLIFSSDYKTLDVAISSLINGISKQFVKSALDTLKLSNTVSSSSLFAIYDYINSILANDCKDAKIKEFKDNYSIFYFQNAKEVVDNNELLNKNQNASLGQNNIDSNLFLDDFYTKKLLNEEYVSYRNTLLKILSSTLDKIVKKLENINNKIETAKKLDEYKVSGELLIANIYKFTNDYSLASNNKDMILVTENTEYVELENFYDNNNLIKIKINPTISISKNAEKYFKKYNKAKNTLEVTKIQKIETQKELNYIETLVYSLDNCKNIQDVDEVYNEISENLLFSSLNLKNKNSQKANDSDSMLNNYMKFKIDDYDVFIGKNNRQNDYLTLKLANPNDYWFHTKDIHGSHLILRCNGETPKIETITKCAELAAYYSKAKFSSHIPVDYTLVKNVKKPHGASPGFVIYSTNKTIYVNPSSGIDLK